MNEELDARVAERTQQLDQVIEKLKHEIEERKKVEEKLNESYKQIRSLSEHLQNIREEERTRIAREIHDELGQLLTVLKMDIGWLNKKINNTSDGMKEKLKDISQLVDTTVQSVRRISSELRPSLLDDLGLVAAMEWHLKEFEHRTNIKTFFQEPEEDLELSDGVKTGLFRIFQESLTNVARHAQASEIHVSLTNYDGMLRLSIQDNGTGFDPQMVSEKRTLGILGMKERTEMMGGEYQIQTETGKGTTITVRLPVQKEVNTV
jgi:signal transduction histidine kinase